MFRRRRSSRRQDDPLRRCPSCRSRLACPTAWTPRDDAHWHVALRCGDCGRRWDLDVDDARAARFDVELDADVRAIRGALRSLELERMAADIETFAIALSRDLIEPADFAL